MLTMSNIEQEMRHAIDRYFTFESLRSYAHTYLDSKLEESLYFSNLLYFHYEMFDGEANAQIDRASAAIELLILSSDILDDIQDQDSPLKPWMQTPMPLALNVAFSLLIAGQQMLQECDYETKRLRLAIETVNRSILISLNGQMRDLMNDAKDSEAYIEMVKEKSASLIVMASMVGVILATGQWNYTVEAYAREMGIMAQLSNDLRDSLRTDEKSDFVSDKHTLPKLYNMSESMDMDLDKREQLYEDNGTILYMQVMIKAHYYSCMESFNSLPQSEAWRKRFDQFFTRI